MPTKPQGQKAVRTSITLPPEVLAKLKDRLKPGESLSALIGRIIADSLKNGR
jgi:hypothetical protein